MSKLCFPGLTLLAIVFLCVFSGATPKAPERQQGLNRGKYLVEEVARCWECHSPRDASGQADHSRWLAPGRSALVRSHSSCTRLGLLGSFHRWPGRLHGRPDTSSPGDRHRPRWQAHAASDALVSSFPRRRSRDRCLPEVIASRGSLKTRKPLLIPRGSGVGHFPGPKYRC